MKKQPHSIRMEILLDTLLVLVTLSVALALTGTYVVQQLAKADSQQIMSMKCEEESLRVDNNLNLVQHSVMMVNAYARELQDNGELDVLSDEYERRVKELALSIAEDTAGAMAVYFRYDPEVAGDGVSGFFWSRMAAGEGFTEEPPTDILAFPQDDVEHVGWFFVPKATGQPMWMPPYYNKNLGVLMISYIIPLMDTEGDFIGVIGMDIDFRTIMNDSGSVSLYKNDRIALVDLSAEKIYYRGKDGASEEGDLLPAIKEHLRSGEGTTDSFDVVDDRGEKVLSCSRMLSNGMILYVSVPRKEINARRNTMFGIMLLVTVLVSALSIFAVWRNTKDLVQPIRKLVETADKYASGNWESKYVCDSGNELQELSESISSMAAQTKEYISKLDNLARIDVLTGLGNKNSYLELAEEIRENRNGRYDDYAVAVMDLNNLKRTNDHYGHETGDLLIIEAGRYICSIFAKSEVFRIGGDEFVAVLLGEDYESRLELEQQFQEGMPREIDGVMLSVACGIAAKDEEPGDFFEIFKLADKRMYRKKEAMHNGSSL